MRRRRSHCQQCGRPDDVAGQISRSGLCADCGRANLQANLDAMAAKSGPAYNLYRRRWEAGVQRYAQRSLPQADSGTAGQP